jgi:hypothetical protein
MRHIMIMFVVQGCGEQNYTGQRRDLIEDLMRALVLTGHNQIGWQDQVSMDTIVWPGAK